MMIPLRKYSLMIILVLAATAVSCALLWVSHNTLHQQERFATTLLGDRVL